MTAPDEKQRWSPPEGFEPDGPTGHDGIFGLPARPGDLDRARVVLLPVPFDATCSYRLGAAAGPATIRRASDQIELKDRLVGDAWRHGIVMCDAPDWIPAVLANGRDAARRNDPAGVQAAAGRVFEHVRHASADVLSRGQIPGLIGGEHGVSLGSILACAEHERDAGRPPIGVLQIDAHMDLRAAYQGVTLSHASVMREALTRDCDGVGTLVQIGVRDHGRGELAFAAAEPRVRTVFADEIDADRHDPAALGGLFNRAIAWLPDAVYLTFDIDALDPSLCPNTGTPVPGGLTWQDATMLLAAIQTAGKRVVGFDLVEVSPGGLWTPDQPDTLDAIIGARLLYRLCGVAAASVST